MSCDTGPWETFPSMLTYYFEVILSWYHRGCSRKHSKRSTAESKEFSGAVFTCRHSFGGLVSHNRWSKSSRAAPNVPWPVCSHTANDRLTLAKSPVGEGSFRPVSTEWEDLPPAGSWLFFSVHGSSDTCNHNFSQCLPCPGEAIFGRHGVTTDHSATPLRCRSLQCTTSGTSLAVPITPKVMVWLREWWRQSRAFWQSCGTLLGSPQLQSNPSTLVWTQPCRASNGQTPTDWYSSTKESVHTWLAISHKLPCEGQGAEETAESERKWQASQSQTTATTFRWWVSQGANSWQTSLQKSRSTSRSYMVDTASDNVYYQDLVKDRLPQFQLSHSNVPSAHQTHMLKRCGILVL